MGNMFGQTTMPVQGNPIVGTGNQNNFIQALMNQTMHQDPSSGAFQLSGVSPYSGQMAVDPNQTMLGGVYNSWNPNLASGVGNTAGGLMNGQNSTINSIMGGGYGSAAGGMNNLAAFGAAGQAGLPQNMMAQGYTQGTPLALLNGYMRGQPVASPQGGGGGNGGQAPSPALWGSMANGMGGIVGGGVASNKMQPVGTRGGPAGMIAGAPGGASNVPQGAMNPLAGGQGFPGMNAQNANVPAMTNPNAALGSLSGQMGYLGNIAGGGGAGAPVDQTPAWQQMVNSQQYNIKQGADQLAEQFNNGGGLFSTAYGAAAGQYQQQAQLGQNALLGQMSTQAMQQANQNQLGAAQQLSSQGYGALSGLSGQQYGASQQAAGLGSQAALQAAQLSAGATQNMYNTQTNAGLQGLNMGLQNSLGAGQLNLQNLGMGSQLGGQQAGLQQNQLTSQYNNWLMSQPQNNPLLQMLQATSMGYPQMIQPSYSPGMMGSLMGGVGSIMGGLGMMGGSAGIAGLSDQRLKENITKVGRVKDVNLYSYNFKGLPDKQIGVLAQEVHKCYPEAVLPGDNSTPWRVKYDALAQLLTSKN